jgi:hypothetical protein
MAEASICPIDGCENSKGVDKLFCLSHWRMVSSVTQTKVWTAWRAVQRREAGATETYREAVRLATAEVATAEAKRNRQGRLI